MKAKAGMKLVRDKADQVRMAGKVAGVGAVLGRAVMAATNKDDDDKSWREKHYALQDELLKKQIAKLDQDNYGEGYPKPPEASAPPEMNVPTPSGSTGQSLPNGNTDNLQGTFSGGSLDTESVNGLARRPTPRR